MKQKFDIIQSTCIPIQIDNCNTDLIIPARYLASTTRDPKFFGDAFMHDLRYDANGKAVEEFVMNTARLRSPAYTRLSSAAQTGAPARRANMPHGPSRAMA